MWRPPESDQVEWAFSRQGQDEGMNEYDEEDDEQEQIRRYIEIYNSSQHMMNEETFSEAASEDVF